MKLKDIHPLAAEILGGKYDGEAHGFDILDVIVQACEGRKKFNVQSSGIRKNAKVRVKDMPESKEFAGREGVVSRVSQKSVTVAFPCVECGSVRENEASECDKCWGYPDTIRVPSALLEAVSS